MTYVHTSKPFFGYMHIFSIHLIVYKILFIEKEYERYN
jgi:hypothetical protein